MILNDQEKELWELMEQAYSYEWASFQWIRQSIELICTYIISENNIV